MNYSRLGSTDIEVSEIAFGGVSIGLPYGIGVDSEVDMPTDQESVALVQQALDQGINFFDTARGYGKSEKLIGMALKDRREKAVICTKPSSFYTDGQFMNAADIKAAINNSVNQSLEALQCDHIDVLMSHNGTLEVINNQEVVETFESLKKAGVIRAKGVSVYTVEQSIAAIDSGVWDVIQLPYNLMDQTQARVFVMAKARGVGIVVRSVLFKGILTEKGRTLHAELESVSKHRDRLCRELLDDGEVLSDIATRFVLSQEGVSSVLIGIDKMEYLKKALAVAKSGRIPEVRLKRAKELAYPDTDFLDLPKWNKMGWLN